MHFKIINITAIFPISTNNRSIGEKKQYSIRSRIIKKKIDIIYFYNLYISYYRNDIRFTNLFQNNSKESKEINLSERRRSEEKKRKKISKHLEEICLMYYLHKYRCIATVDDEAVLFPLARIHRSIYRDSLSDGILTEALPFICSS